MTPVEPNGKLVRDKIPEYIRADNEEPVTKVLSLSEFAQALNDKLVEEVNEVISANTSDNQLEELADLTEVILAKLALLGYAVGDLEKIRVDKAQKRGVFSQRLFLVTNK